MLAFCASAAAGQAKIRPTPSGTIYAPFTWSANGYALPDGDVGLHISVGGGWQTNGYIEVDCGAGYQQATTWNSDNALQQPETVVYGAYVHVPAAAAVGRACTVSIVIETGWLWFGGEYILSDRPAKH